MENLRNKKIIGLDMDGVIINHTSLKLKLAEQFGFKLKPKETHSEVIKTIVSQPILEQIKWNLYDNPNFLKAISLMPGAKSGLSQFKKINLPFVLISRRKDSKLAIEVLKFHELWPKFFNTRNTFFVSEPEDKNIKARELGVTHYVDDEFSVLEKLNDVENKFLFDCFGNFEEIKKYTRVASWDELTNYFVN